MATGTADAPEKKVTPSDQQKDASKTPGVANYGRILSYGARIEHVFLIIGLCSAAASGVALPLMNIVFGSLIGNFNGYDASSGTSPEDAFRHSTARNALYLVYLFIGKFVLTYVGIFCFRTVGLRISAALRLGYMQALFLQPIKKLDQVSVGTVVNTITSSANDIQASISDRLSGMFQSMALVIAAYAIAFRYSWQLTLAVSSGILFVILVLTITTPFALKAMRRVQKADERHATVTSETFSSIRTVFALGAEARMTERHSEGVTESHIGNMKMGKWITLQLSPFFFTIYASYALAFWFGLKLYRDGHIGSVTNVIVVFFSVLLVTTVMGQIAQPIMHINKAITASTEFFEMIDSDRVQAGGLKAPEVSAYDNIELKEVTFAYPTRPSVQVLKKFSATIQKGKTTALVGPSGSGKSTIVGLLERWYVLGDAPIETAVNAPDSTATEESTVTASEKHNHDSDTEDAGSISIGGHNIKDLDLKWWRSQIGLVQQEPFLFNDTIAKNVAYGLIGTVWEDADDERKLELVKEACVEAFAAGFIEKLPQGYLSKVGEGGIKLSGGQRQRIAIARSIVRKPAILILDEATSAIDVHGERIVQQALDRASEIRTTIMIAHRLSTIRKADHIIVLRSGEKIEEGTHAELMTLESGLYSGLVRAQQIDKIEGQDGDDQMDELLIADPPTLKHTATLQSLAISDADAAEPQNDTAKNVTTTFKKRGLFASIGVLMYEQKSAWMYYVAIVLAAMGCGAAYSLQSWFFAQLVQTFQYVGQRLINAANFWSLMFFVLALSVTACYGVMTMAAGRVSTHIGTSCRRRYFKDALQMPISYFDQEENSSGSVMQRISSDPKQIQDLLGVNSMFPLISLFNVIGCVIIAFYFGWKLTLVVFFAVMPVIIGASFFRMRYEIQFDTNNSKVFSTSSQFASEAIGAFRTVSSLGMEDVVINRYKTLLADQIRSSTRKASYGSLVFALTDSIELCGMALAFWYGGQLLASGEYAAFQFFVVYTAIVQGSQAAGQYLSVTPNLAYATASANRMLELRSRIADQGKVGGNSPPQSSTSGSEIVFKDVRFQYPGNLVPLFSNLNITINAGQFVAFVGASGCGKTTTISMLERFYDPSVGTITVDGHDIATLDTRLYRNRLALVSQEPRLFSGTIMANLLLGVEQSEISEEQVIQACRDAEIHDFIISLPDGYNTELGQNTQTTLSGGQKQRLCLARALLRRPKLLLLDEATSSLDSQSEKLIQGAIERLAGQRSMTVIAVAHRLATIQKADVIFVFGERDVESNKGSKIVERGSHSELFAKRGVYWSMCKAQALDQ